MQFSHPFFHSLHCRAGIFPPVPIRYVFIVPTHPAVRVQFYQPVTCRVKTRSQLGNPFLLFRQTSAQLGKFCRCRSSCQSSAECSRHRFICLPLPATSSLQQGIIQRFHRLDESIPPPGIVALIDYLLVALDTHPSVALAHSSISLLNNPCAYWESEMPCALALFTQCARCCILKLTVYVLIRCPCFRGVYLTFGVCLPIAIFLASKQLPVYAKSTTCQGYKKFAP